jgi:hypothetical protein
VHDEVVAPALEADRTHQVAADEKAAEHEERRKSGEIENQGEILVEGPAKETYAEERVGDVGLDKDQPRADEQEKKSPEEEGVGRSRPLLAQDLPLQKDSPQSVDDPLSGAIGAQNGTPLTIDRQTPPEPDKTDPEGGKGEEIHGPEDSVPDVPVDFPCRFHRLDPWLR